MLERMTNFCERLGITWGEVLWGVGLFVATFVISLAVVAFIVVRLPATYFADGHERTQWRQHHPALRWTLVIGKNLIGVVLVGLGILLSLPGVPGQGILTILIGLMLMDFPGRRRLERRLVSRPAVFRAVNRLRARYGRPPLVLDLKETTAENAQSHLPVGPER